MNDPSAVKLLYFKHPDTGVREPWIIFNPSNLPKIENAGYSERIIAAAPVLGGRNADDGNLRLVLFESGRAVSIPNELFILGTTAHK